MNDIENSGMMNYGSGDMNVTNSPFLRDVTVLSRWPSEPPVSDRRRKCDIGVVTILAEEANAVRKVFGLKEDNARAGQQPFYSGKVELPARSVDMVAIRTLQPGQGSVIPGLENLRRYYDPAALVMVGIGGGIHGDLALDDVVVATRIVSYDMRQVTPERVLHRGEERHSPAWMMHAVNSFFTDHGDPAELSTDGVGGRTSRFRIFCGPIGSGNAVIADRESEIRGFLSAYNEKTLAVDTEAGGLSQFCHETSSASGGVPGWVVIRGISDHADRIKNDDHHISSAMNAAFTLRELIPYIVKREQPSSE